jgi:hypothetical protein
MNEKEKWEKKKKKKKKKKLERQATPSICLPDPGVWYAVGATLLRDTQRFRSEANQSDCGLLVLLHKG